MLSARQKAQLHRLHKEYLLDLRERVLRAPCPRCKAKPKQLCRGIDQRSGRKRDWATSTHWDRHNEAKRLGFVHGKHFAV